MGCAMGYAADELGAQTFLGPSQARSTLACRPVAVVDAEPLLLHSRATILVPAAWDRKVLSEEFALESWSVPGEELRLAAALKRQRRRRDLMVHFNYQRLSGRHGLGGGLPAGVAAPIQERVGPESDEPPTGLGALSTPIRCVLRAESAPNQSCEDRPSRAAAERHRGLWGRTSEPSRRIHHCLNVRNLGSSFPDMWKEFGLMPGTSGAVLRLPKASRSGPDMPLHHLSEARFRGAAVSVSRAPLTLEAPEGESIVFVVEGNMLLGLPQRGPASGSAEVATSRLL